LFHITVLTQTSLQEKPLLRFYSANLSKDVEVRIEGIKEQISGNLKQANTTWEGSFKIPYEGPESETLRILIKAKDLNPHYGDEVASSTKIRARRRNAECREMDTCGRDMKTRAVKTRTIASGLSERQWKQVS